MELLQYNEKILKYNFKFRRISTAVLFLIPLISMSDWLRSITGMKPYNHFFTINPLADFLFLFAGIALLIYDKDYKKLRLFQWIIPFSIIILASIKLLEYYSAIDISFIEIIKTENFPILRKFTEENPFELNIAICLLLAGISFILFRSKSQKTVLTAQFFSLIVFIISFLTLLGFLYGAGSLLSFDPLFPMKFGSSVCLFFLSVSMIGLRPDTGFVKTLTADYAGGYLLRKILPVAILLPVIIGWLRLESQVFGILSLKFGIAVHTLLNIFILIIFIWVIAGSLNKSDINKKKIEEDLKAANDRFLLLAQIIPIGLYLRNQNGECIFVNEFWTKLTGLTFDESLGYGWQKALLIEDKEQVNSKIREHIQSGRTLRMEYRIRDRERNVKWVLSQSVEERDKNGNLTGYIGTITDITGLKNAQKKLTEANANKDKLFAIISHDLKGPYTALLGYSDLLKNDSKGLTEDEYQGIVDSLYDTIRDAYKLIDDLLQWAMIQQGTIEPDIRQIEINKEIDRVIEYLGNYAGFKNINIEKKLDENIEVLADTGMIRTILRNILSNAIKFSNKGGKIYFKTEKEEENFCLSVKDYGIGMSQETMNNLFNVGTKVSTRGTANEKGTGLGLQLCKELLEKQNGKIEIESEEGKGTVIRIYLPLGKKEFTA